MNKIEYPDDIISFENEYYDIIPKHNEAYINYILNKLPLTFPRITFRTLLLFTFDDILNHLDIIEKNLLPILSYIEKKKFLEQFEYDSYQSHIASFFMNHTIEMNMKTCYYCNIEFINTFEDIGEYENNLDFLVNGTLAELKKYIGPERGDLIYKYLELNTITKVEDISIIKGIGKKTIILINNLQNKIKAFKNHFTLDHFVPKGKYPYIALSLYNLVPSCSSCNSKFKKEKQYEIGEYLKYISPTSRQFDLHNHIEFKLYFKASSTSIQEKITKTNDLDDFSVRPEIATTLDKKSQNFLDIFKIRGRYRFHKYQSMHLIKKRQIYSDSAIQEISKITGKSCLEIKKDIFGTIMFNNLEINEPLAKYKKDIGRQIGLF
ncbi:hypothetical protein MTQ00_02695 [Chryseobacterium sp. B21-037]|uniref:HNH endonuclease n=1 Tax=Chryseobacterium sp. B21-037 TaxID=2926038 RepID=UPI00235922E0|nr:hypothetical protein [Chryseobacterium sp. B21-037]MDC8103437.1 hypothetical protein [Chryseobacterium sp. B21-037]